MTTTKGEAVIASGSGDAIEVLYRPARPASDPAARYPGFRPEDRIIPAGSIVKPGARPLICDIHVCRDVAVPLRDGTRIFVDVFRPVGDTAAPVLVAWSPFGKQGGVIVLDDIPQRAGVPQDWLSGLEMFEGPDPAFWCAHGYAVVNVDARGAFSSEGDIHFWGRREGKDGYDLVEWIARQPWSNGKVGLTGNSWLAIAQWFIAAEAPPHLAAIAPWEGWTDFYRYDVVRGGIPDFGFNEHTTEILAGGGRVEDVPEMVRRHPLMNAYWQDKIPLLENIDMPAYVVGSWTNLIHGMGTFDGFMNIASNEKWLRVHNTHEWTDYYTQVDDLRRFFDCYLGGVANDWGQTPRVRLAVLDPGRRDVVDRPEREFPLTRTQYHHLHLDAADRSMSDRPVGDEATAVYCCDDGVDQLAFCHRFERDVELTGYFSLKLWVEALDTDDTDVYVEVRKLHKNGRRAVARNITPPDPAVAKELERLYRAGKAQFGMMFFSGAKGMLRASHRATDPTRSLPGRPFHTHDLVQKLKPGEIAPLDIQIWPLGMKWRAGEQVQVIVAGHKLSTAEMPGLTPAATINKGRVRVHTGGRYDSYLVIPLVGEPE